MNLTIYCIGSISGLSYKQAVDNFVKREKELIKYGFDVLIPLLDFENLRNEIELKAHGYDDKPLSTNRAIVGRDRWLVKQADIIFADFSLLDNTEDNTIKNRISIGSCFEMAWGFDTGKHVVTVMGKNNVHQHSFILSCSDVVFETLDDAYKYFRLYKKVLIK